MHDKDSIVVTFLTLIISSRHTFTSVSNAASPCLSDGVQFIKEEHARSSRPCLVKHVTNVSLRFTKPHRQQLRALQSWYNILQNLPCFVVEFLYWASRQPSRSMLGIVIYTQHFFCTTKISIAWNYIIYSSSRASGTSQQTPRKARSLVEGLIQSMVSSGVIRMIARFTHESTQRSDHHPPRAHQRAWKAELSSKWYRKMEKQHSL